MASLEGACERKWVGMQVCGLHDGEDVEVRMQV